MLKYPKSYAFVNFLRVKGASFSNLGQKHRTSPGNSIEVLSPRPYQPTSNARK